MSHDNTLASPMTDDLFDAPLFGGEVATPILSALKSPSDLKSASIADLQALAREIREVICNLSKRRSIHFASNLGVVELTIALHYAFDFAWDRLVWDVGHQCYPHKLLTGRFDQFETLRTKGGLSGYPNPSESEYDLFMTGHAGTSVGTALGLAVGDLLAGCLETASTESSTPLELDASPASARRVKRTSADATTERARQTVAVVGDGAFSSGPIFEALNHAGDLQQKMLVVLNDNKMSICKRVGGFGRYLDHLRMTPSYLGAKTRIRRLVENIPSAYAFVSRIKDALKSGLIGGALFEDLGFHYVGPIDGHDLPTLIKYFEAIKTVRGPVLLHVLTEKGRGYRPAEIDPSHFHSSKPVKVQKTQDVDKKDASRARKREKLIGRPVGKDSVLEKTPDEPSRSSAKIVDSEQSFTYWAQLAIMRALRENPRVCVVVAAMTQGNMLEDARALYPDRFFDVGICEAHAVNFAAGLAKSGMLPIVDVYSGFLQRAYDHLFQEASLQNLPIVFSLDRSGFVGADGATHHGVFDLSYFRPLPNITLLAPCDSDDMGAAFEFALNNPGPTAIRYPKTRAGRIERPTRPFELGRAEVLREGRDGAIILCGGGLAATAYDVAAELADAARAEPLDVGIINARFIKPLDVETLLAPLRRGLPVVTVEENAAPGGFGAALLEAANEAGVDARAVVRLAAPDYYVPHGSREEELAEVGLDRLGIMTAFLKARERAQIIRG